VAVLGTYYLQTLRWAFEPGLAGVALGLLACAVLVVNNIRDAEQDAKANKKTLVVRLGKNFGQSEYVFCLLMPALIAFWLKAYLSSLLVLVAFLFIRKSSLEKLLPQTAFLILMYALLFSFARL
jgi:1,4-dihydroxy-2-naphthoate octaprenyltransferase